MLFETQTQTQMSKSATVYIPARIYLSKFGRS